MRLRATALPSALAALVAVAGCSGTPAAPSAAPAGLHGAVSDPAGDARPLIANPPDLVSATIDVSNGLLTLTVTFAPGTLSQTQTVFQALLDVDENPQTGFPGVDAANNDAGLLGADYTIQAVTPRNSNQAIILRAGSGNQATTVGTATVTFPSPDQARVVVPLTLLGNDDGRMKFKVTCFQWLTDTSATGVTDYMPDIGLPPGVVR